EVLGQRAGGKQQGAQDQLFHGLSPGSVVARDRETSRSRAEPVPDQAEEFARTFIVPTEMGVAVAAQSEAPGVSGERGVLVGRLSLDVAGGVLQTYDVVCETGGVGETVLVRTADLDARRFGSDDGATRRAEQKLFLVAAEQRGSLSRDRLFLLLALERP